MQDITKDYISQCEEVLESKDLHKAETLINKIVGVFESHILNLDQGLDSYTSYLGNHQMDYLGDIAILKDRLTQYLKHSKKDSVPENDAADLSVLFQDVRKKVENYESLPKQRIQEILHKITDIEEILATAKKS